MRRSHTISIDIACGYARAYGFLADPRNYTQWGAVEASSFRPTGSGDWQGETSFSGHMHFRFSPANGYGVLDHAAFKPGTEPHWTPMRLVPNEQGCLLTFTFFARPGMSEQAFDTAVEWITVDFLALKSVLEALEG